MLCFQAVTEPSEPRPADPAVDSLEGAVQSKKKSTGHLLNLWRRKHVPMFGL